MSVGLIGCCLNTKHPQLHFEAALTKAASDIEVRKTATRLQAWLGNVEHVTERSFNEDGVLVQSF